MSTDQPAYQAVDKYPDFPSIEQRILALWEQTGAFDLLRQKNAGGPRWSFLDGPITANNPMGVHHAWGRSLKDIYQRYHAMCGHELRYQNGFDCQGLWVEVEVEKQHGFKSKLDIEQYGVAKFVEDCKARVIKFSAVQTEQSKRLGYWMDWDDSYFTMSEDNNYTIWSFLQRCHRRGYVYKGFDSMTWCPRCGVGLSQMELHEGYRWVEHTAVFVRFPLRDRDQEALLVWTTTPWTLSSNVGAAVHPEMKYLRVRAGDGWTYIVGADNWKNNRTVEIEEEAASGRKRRNVKLHSLQKMLGRLGDFEVLGEVQGRELLGLSYHGPFDELPAQHEPGGYPHPGDAVRELTGVSCHRIIAWDMVTGTEGTGIVHIAPGCGKEDYELSHKEKIVAISPLDQFGVFLPAFGPLAGKNAHDVAPEVVANLRDKGILIGQEEYPHRYAHCWRCSTPILYRLVDEWYISMDWREEIMGTVGKIRWIPDYGEQRELDWLRNMGDWMISKKRYWGLALPIWQCDRHDARDPKDRCEWFDVIGGREQLRERAIAGWEAFDGHTPHRPWIDAVKVRCEKCGGMASRIPDVGNPWLDAGIVPYSTMRYDSDPEYHGKWFPAELVLECFPGQFRNWFYALLAMNTMMQDDRWADRAGGESSVVPPFRTLLGHALVRDEHGREMHKSAGNAIEFNTAAATIGAEVMRYIYASRNPVNNLNFPDISSDRDPNVLHGDQEVVRKLLTLWNCYSFYVTYATVDGITPAQLQVPLSDRADLDRWIISKFQGLVDFAHDCYGNYRVNLLVERFERFVDELSNWYLRRSRRRLWKSESDTDKLAAYATLYEMLEGVCRVMAPVMPFLSEEIYQNIVRSAQPDAPVSVHLLEFPPSRPDLVDTELVERIDTVIRYKNMGLGLRAQANLKVRQPLARLIVKPATEAERAALGVDALRAQLMEEVNVEAIELVDTADDLVQVEIKPDFRSIGQKFRAQVKAIQQALPSADPRLVARAVQGGGTYALDLGGGEVVQLSAEDVVIRHIARPDLAVMSDGDAFAALETTVTPALQRKGSARDFVRCVQDLRKARGLNVSDRINVRYTACAEVTAAVTEHASFIAQEVLATDIALLDGLQGETCKVGGNEVVLDLSVV